MTKFYTALKQNINITKAIDAEIEKQVTIFENLKSDENSPLTSYKRLPTNRNMEIFLLTLFNCYEIEITMFYNKSRAIVNSSYRSIWRNIHVSYDGLYGSGGLDKVTNLDMDVVLQRATEDYEFRLQAVANYNKAKPQLHMVLSELLTNDKFLKLGIRKLKISHNPNLDLSKVSRIEHKVEFTLKKLKHEVVISEDHKPSLKRIRLLGVKVKDGEFLDLQSFNVLANTFDRVQDNEQLKNELDLFFSQYLNIFNSYGRRTILHGLIDLQERLGDVIPTLENNVIDYLTGRNINEEGLTHLTTVRIRKRDIIILDVDVLVDLTTDTPNEVVLVYKVQGVYEKEKHTLTKKVTVSDHFPNDIYSMLEQNGYPIEEI